MTCLEKDHSSTMALSGESSREAGSCDAVSDGSKAGVSVRENTESKGSNSESSWIPISATRANVMASSVSEFEPATSHGGNTKAEVPVSNLMEVKSENEDLVADILNFSDLDIAGPINHVKLPDPSENDLGIGCDVMENVLCVPEDDLAEIDWLMFPDIYGIQDAYLCNQERRDVTHPDGLQRNTPLEEPSFLLTPVPSRARSKRSRGMRRVWSCDVLSDRMERSSKRKLPKLLPGLSSASCDSQSSPLGSLSMSDTGVSSYEALIGSAESKFEPYKKIKFSAKFGMKRGSTITESGMARKCSHCSSTKTPQWRAGPNGPKTLCNACGVRFKSGRLCPEYRPASSPEFVGEVHSNSHRKILEMRRQKLPEWDMEGAFGKQESGHKPWKLVEHKSPVRSKKTGDLKLEVNIRAHTSQISSSLTLPPEVSTADITVENTKVKPESVQLLSDEGVHGSNMLSTSKQETSSPLTDAQLSSSNVLVHASFGFARGPVESAA